MAVERLFLLSQGPGPGLQPGLLRGPLLSLGQPVLKLRQPGLRLGQLSRFVVAAAVLTGMIYYFAECNAAERETEGTLVDRRWEAESGIEQ